MPLPEPSASTAGHVPDVHAFLAGGGEMGARLRAHDWSASPLGAPQTWPQSLRTVVSLMLTSRFPMFLVWGPDLAFLYNDAYAPILGARHPQALGRPFREIWSEIWEDIGPLTDRALAGEASFHEDLPLLMQRKGYEEQTWFTFSYSPVRDETGHIAGMFCACTETTQKVLAERRLAAEGDRLRDLFRQAPSFMAVARGPDHVFEMVNEAYLQVVGHRKLIGKTVREALPEVEGQGFFELLDRVYQTGEPFVGHGLPIKLQRRPDGPLEDRFVTFIYQPVRGLDGQVTGIFAEGYDVTEAKMAEEALRQSEAKYRTLFETMDEGYLLAEVIFDADDRPVDVLYLDENPAAVRMTGRSIVGCRLSELNPDYEPHWPEIFGRVARTGQGERRELYAGMLQAWYEFYVFRPGGADSRRVAVIYKDVTDRKRAEEELRRLNQTLEQRVDERTREREAALSQLAQAQKLEAVGQLTGGVAHDFNNLLQALAGCLTMIGRRTGEPKVHSLVEIGQQAVDRGAKLVQQLMAFARRESLRPEPIDVRERVLGMSELLARALRADIRVVTDFGPGLWPVEVDPTQFELALINLAVNARDAMPNGGTLSVTAANVDLPLGDPSGLVGAYVQVSVSDTGAGMPDAVAARAFEPFYTTKEVGKGSGLGLAQVYGLARQAGGSARIESTPGQGTTVTLWLRRTTATVAPARSEPGTIPATRRRGRVLLVEDDQVVAATVAAALEDAGYSVPWVTTADEALALLAGDTAFDLVFSDVVMPGTRNGVDLAREVGRLRPNLPVVLTTGYSERVAQLEGIHVLRKPYRIEELVRALDAALGETEHARASAGG